MIEDGRILLPSRLLAAITKGELTLLPDWNFPFYLELSLGRPNPIGASQETTHRVGGWAEARAGIWGKPEVFAALQILSDTASCLEPVMMPASSQMLRNFQFHPSSPEFIRTCITCKPACYQQNIFHVLVMTQARITAFSFFLSQLRSSSWIKAVLLTDSLGLNNNLICHVKLKGGGSGRWLYFIIPWNSTVETSLLQQRQLRYNFWKYKSFCWAGCEVFLAGENSNLF